MKKDLTWTGSQFLDVKKHTERILSVAAEIDYTSKDEVWSESVAEAAAAHFHVPSEFVRVASGATQLIESIFRSFSHGLIVDVTPNFHLSATLARQENWMYQSVAVRQTEELLPALKQILDRTDAIIIFSSPRNPLGYQFALEDISALLDRAKGLVVIDEVYADFGDDTALKLVQKYERLIVVRTLSKAWGLANLRIGFAVSAAFARPNFHFHLIPNSVTGIAQRAARYLFAHPSAVQESIAEAKECRQNFLDRLRQIPGLNVWHSDANYLCIEIDDASAIASALDDAGYKVRLLHDLKGYPENWPVGIRITVPPRSDIERIVGVISLSQTSGRGETVWATR